MTAKYENVGFPKFLFLKASVKQTCISKHATHFSEHTDTCFLLFKMRHFFQIMRNLGFESLEISTIKIR